MGLPFRFTYFLLLYSSALIVLRPRVGSIFYKTDICPISLIPELLGMVDKAAEYGSVRRWVLSGRVVRITSPRYFGSPYKFVPIPVLPLYSGGILDLPRTELSSAASQNCFVLCIVELGPQLSSAWAFGFSRSNWAWPLNYWAPQ